MKRSKVTVAQADLFPNLPMPAPGTVAILRIEDWQKSFPSHPVVAVSGTPSAPRNSEHQSARTESAAAKLEGLLTAWLDKQDPSATASSKTIWRAPELGGKIIAVHCSEVAFELGVSIKLAAIALQRIGWSKRYITSGQPGERMRLYFRRYNPYKVTQA